MEERGLKRYREKKIKNYKINNSHNHQLRYSDSQFFNS